MDRTAILYSLLAIIFIFAIVFYVSTTQNKSLRSGDAPSHTPSPTTVPTEQNNDTVQVYLVAINDRGQQGKEFGCQDSIVPVTISIPPTDDPLRGAIEQLLQIDQTYGDTDLYNAFYQSKLQIDSVQVTNGIATIRLSGDFVIGGVCDEPRIKEQIRETALQFPTVESVRIYINGQML